MTIEQDIIIAECKEIINRGDLELLQSVYDEYVNHTEFETPIAWDYVFQKIYLHACLKKQRGIVEWLDQVYSKMNPVMQIALRQMFPYARQLLSK